jgi:ribonuclease H / adenosylcobalamin/alpha-ribazole phosphatase
VTHRRVLIEADGGSRGNPGPAAYGAVLKNADTGAVIAEDGTSIGVATNNVAEYSGLIAGLKLAAQFAPEAEVGVRMDSKLVVEQMSGRWKIKHRDMVPLAAEATRLAPPGTTYTWVPREQNAHADRLANEALDGTRQGVSSSVDEEGEERARPETSAETPADRFERLGKARAAATTLVLVRHGVTEHTTERRFSGGLASANPALNDEGRAQARETGAWLAPLKADIDLLVTSPVRRTRETADLIAAALGGADVVEEHGFAEMEFGAWDGLTFLEVAEQHADDLQSWFGDFDHRPGGGESFFDVQRRVLAARDRLLEEHAGKTVVVVSHVTPIKLLVTEALKAPMEAVYRMELVPASVTVLSYFTGPDGERVGSLRLFNAKPGDSPLVFVP